MIAAAGWLLETVHLVWHWNLNTSLLDGWNLDIDDLGHVASDNSLLSDDSWAFLANSLVSWADLGHLSKARNFDIDGDLNRNFHWNVYILVLGDENIFSL